ncbi:MAG: type II toxin-antitoxin system VapC family toxin [Pseudomonadota bacterium]|nr:type II toxin-antitoxin system VapC family toxin [Pseudomonadota bacterium]
MSPLLLDTNTCIHLLNDGNPEIKRRMRIHSPTQIFLCSVVKAELLYGARHSRRVSENLQLLERLFAPLSSVPFDDRSAEEYGVIRAQLAAECAPIGPNDLMIAAIARSRDMTLITHNIDEFRRVTGLRLVDWEEPEGESAD